MDLPRPVHPDVGAGRQASADLTEGGIQGAGVLGQQRIRVRGEAERGQRIGPDRLPLCAFQQLGLRVTPLGGGGGVDLAALQAAPEPLQHAEGIGMPVH